MSAEKVTETVDASPATASISSSDDQIPDKAKEHVHVAVKEYFPSEEALKLPPGAGGVGNNAFANEPSPFDDPEFRKHYWPRSNYEGLHRFFPDFKWTVGEEKK